MRSLLKVTHDPDVDASYLYYSELPVKRQLNLNADCSLNVDLDDSGEIVGIELLRPGNAELEVLVKFANEHDLSLERLFEFA